MLKFILACVVQAQMLKLQWRSNSTEETDF